MSLLFKGTLISQPSWFSQEILGCHILYLNSSHGFLQGSQCFLISPNFPPKMFAPSPLWVFTTCFWHSATCRLEWETKEERRLRTETDSLKEKGHAFSSNLQRWSFCWSQRSHGRQSPLRGWQAPWCPGTKNVKKMNEVKLINIDLCQRFMQGLICRIKSTIKRI